MEKDLLASELRKNKNRFCERIGITLDIEFVRNFKPNWLKYQENQLQLDLYSNELNIAIDYYSANHYSFPNKIHETREEFENIIKQDVFKIKKCKEKGIHLIRIKSSANWLDEMIQFEYVLTANKFFSSGLEKKYYHYIIKNLVEIFNDFTPIQFITDCGKMIEVNKINSEFNYEYDGHNYLFYNKEKNIIFDIDDGRQRFIKLIFSYKDNCNEPDVAIINNNNNFSEQFKKVFDNEQDKIIIKTHETLKFTNENFDAKNSFKYLLKAVNEDRMIQPHKCVICEEICTTKSLCSDRYMCLQGIYDTFPNDVYCLYCCDKCDEEREFTDGDILDLGSQKFKIDCTFRMND